MSVTDVGTRTTKCLKRFISTARKPSKSFSDETKLLEEIGLSSDEGIDFILDLCDEFDFDFPHDFNPFIDAKEKRGLKVREMVDRVATCLKTGS